MNANAPAFSAGVGFYRLLTVIIAFHLRDAATIAVGLLLWAPFERSCHGVTEDCPVDSKIKILLNI